MADDKHVGNPKKELKEAFEDAASKAPPGGEYKAEIYVTTTRNPIGDYRVVLTPGSP